MTAPPTDTRWNSVLEQLGIIAMASPSPTTRRRAGVVLALFGETGEASHGMIATLRRIESECTDAGLVRKLAHGLLVGLGAERVDTELRSAADTPSEKGGE